jgi:hypothetical protein
LIEPTIVSVTQTMMIAGKLRACEGASRNLALRRGLKKRLMLDESALSISPF